MSDDRGLGMRVVGGISCVHGDGSSEPRTTALLLNLGAVVIRAGGVGQPVPMRCGLRTCRV
jgi:hypothetical protein